MHQIKTDYFEAGGDAAIFSDIVPFNHWLTYYYPNESLSGYPIAAKVIESADGNLLEDNKLGSPIENIPVDNFSARYVTARHIPSGDYIIRGRADDGIRIYVDGKLVVDRWTDSGYREDAAKVTIDSTESDIHWIEVEYYESGGASKVEVILQPYMDALDTSNFMVEYYKNTSLTGDAVVIGGKDSLQPTSQELNYYWGTKSPHGKIPNDYFSARYTKNFEVTEDNQGEFFLHLWADDGVRVYVDNQLILDDWNPNNGKLRMTNLNLAAGIHTVKIEYLELSGNASIKYELSKQPKASNVVNPKQIYTYNTMVQDIKALAMQYPDLVKYKAIGKSEYGRDIYAVALGNGASSVFINGSHHGREWFTTNLNMYMMDEYAKAYYQNTQIDGYNVRNTLDNTTIWFVPMVNPDGVTLSQSGLQAFPKSLHSSLLAMNLGVTDFTRWKANAKGVDPNRQYDADWANIADDAGKPMYRNYKGTAPVTASETKAIVNFTNEIDPQIAVAYHSTGHILYWNFHQTQELYDRDHVLAKQIGNITGYRLVYPGPNPSGGGFTDWFISQFKRPGFTIEVSPYLYETSVPISYFDDEWSRNKSIGLFIASEGYKLYQN